MPAELYKAGIIEVDEDIDFTEEEELWDITVHFNGEMFTPKLACISKPQAFEIGKRLYNWLENNYRRIQGFEFKWEKYSVERTSIREYPCCYLPYYFLEEGLDVFTFEERDSEAIAYGWITASPLPYYIGLDGLIVIENVTDDAYQAGWCPAWKLSRKNFFGNS
ncbi:hypothetical protein NIES37_70450 (plasmid) [Tolypothrix tenuis PCC 7101]|uniref:Uncharacterized protein n=1 Tax=Tolypothrix tenuis PCC 7101 TaxID=231146 RepID=A0A1Z4NBI0_9CYAN|nr:hypothetical protein NIES37_70450 [Tolypothrix tenuis PCC 7101]BAZ78230.1 hypothetical protein NIES50_68630 [Aulosira laxa NIES-50]